MRPEITARYMGLNLSSPVVVGACPMTRSPETVREYVIAGAGAVVLPSLFEEQIVHRKIELGMEPTDQESDADSTYERSEDHYNGGPVDYLKTIEQLKKVTSVPIIASLDGFTGGTWLSFSRQIESSGADAIELSLHNDFANPALSADDVEEAMLECVRTVCDCVSIPVSVKLLPFFTSLPNLAWRLTESGASGIVVFGREPNWVVQPDELRATTQWSLTPAGHISTAISGLIRVRSGGPASKSESCRRRAQRHARCAEPADQEPGAGAGYGAVQPIGDRCCVDRRRAGALRVLVIQFQPGCANRSRDQIRRSR